MLIEIDEEDLGTLCICAVRYCQGRRTYMPDLVRSIVRPMLGKLSNKDIYVLIEDCKFQERCGLYGDELIDKPDWIKWKSELEHEYERRKEEEYDNRNRRGDKRTD